MNKYVLLPLVLVLGILIASCSDSTTNPPPVQETGSVLINTSPIGASITVDGVSTGKFTPDSVSNLSTGDHSVSLSLTGYRDTTVTVTVVANLLTVKQVNLVSTLNVTKYGPVRIYETAGTGTNEPSGLDLSSGTAYGISGSNNILVDIYYSTNGTGGVPYLVQSADLSPLMTRQTSFSVGGGTDLDDGEASPTYPLGGTWTNNMSDREGNYVYLYDEDGHYSKLIITSYSGIGVVPAWVEVTWYYNNTGADSRF